MTEPPDNPERQQICAALFAGQKIEAIKLYRQMAGVGLKEAKQFIDALETLLRKEQAERFAPPAAATGGGGVLLAVLLGSLALALVWWLVR